MEKVYFDSVCTYNQLYGLPTRHPLVATIDLRQAANYANNIEICGEIYGLFLKNAPYCKLKYGRKDYDFQAGTVVSIAPGQTVTINIPAEDISLDVIGIVFHPHLMLNTTLARSIKQFSFFSYSELESLHLSEKEREKFIFYYNVIREELDQPADAHTAAVVSTNIQLLLEHLQRFYDRQFTTRHKTNVDVVKQFENSLRLYYSQETVGTVPSVIHFAEKANLTPSYFSDLVRKETGSTPKKLISLFIVDEVKRRLIETDNTISEIAYRLGFEYPAHFTRMFKRATGMTPREYRLNMTEINK